MAIINLCNVKSHFRTKLVCLIKLLQPNVQSILDVGDILIASYNFF